MSFWRSSDSAALRRAMHADSAAALGFERANPGRIGEASEVRRSMRKGLRLYPPPIYLPTYLPTYRFDLVELDIFRRKRLASNASFVFLYVSLCILVNREIDHQRLLTFI